MDEHDVEAAGRWVRSSRCEGGYCVEVRTTPAGVELRDAKDPDGPRLAFDRAGWAAFLAGVRAGDFTG